MLMALTLDVNEPKQISGFRTTPRSLQEGTSLLARLASDPAFLHSRVFPFLQQAKSAEDWYVAYRNDAPEGYCSLQVFVWPPGTRTRVHDHSSWGAFCCVAGSMLKERYERLDDGLQPDQARLKKVWRLTWSPESGISTVLPYSGEQKP
jgi:predicted metal-dependent enzyme (double-stranded beta helix superfamily)